ncbi:hypothetical protein PIB30_045641 [Stylosanthes scabra]|uniref:Uncharacterized protein n=1 Tax=Stylosanthes scabra TaxID=79078 RepID=A0ABU6WEN5_9FABA|nr:hypothetical protein [Stylosanthes scabra]
MEPSPVFVDSGAICSSCEYYPNDSHNEFIRDVIMERLESQRIQKGMYSQLEMVVNMMSDDEKMLINGYIVKGMEKIMRKANKNIGSKDGVEKACKSGDFTKEARMRSGEIRIRRSVHKNSPNAVNPGLLDHAAGRPKWRGRATLCLMTKFTSRAQAHDGHGACTPLRAVYSI